MWFIWVAKLDYFILLKLREMNQPALGFNFIPDTNNWTATIIKLYIYIYWFINISHILFTHTVHLHIHIQNGRYEPVLHIHMMPMVDEQPFYISILIGGFTPPKNMSSSDWIVIPTIGENKIHVPNHQPDERFHWSCACQ